MKNHLLVLLALLYSGFCLSAQTLSNYQATVNSHSPNYYFTFDGGSLTDSTGHGVTLSSSPLATTQFASDAFRNPYNSAYFLGKNDTLADPSESTDQIITGGGSASTNSTAAGSITFLFKSLDPGIYTAQKYIVSAGITTSNHNSLSLLFNNTNVSLGSATNSLQLIFGDTRTTLLPFTNVVPNTWYYFAFTYTEATNGYFFDSTGTNLVTIKGKWYFGRAGGALASDVTTNAIDAVAGEGNLFYIGNRPSTDAAFGGPGTGQVDEYATWNRRLTDAEIQAQFSKIPNYTASPPPRSTYQSLITSQSPNYYFKLDGDYKDSVGGTLTLSAIGPTLGFTYDYFGGTTNAVTFVTGGDALTNNGNLLNGGGTYNYGTSGTGQGALSFLFRTLASTNVGGQRFLYSAGGNIVNSNGFALYFDNNTASSSPDALKLRFGDSSHVILQPTNIVTSDWYYFAMNYDESKTNQQVSYWLGQPGGTLQSGTMSATNYSLAGQGNLFIFGDSTNLTSQSFRNSNPTSQGRIDEFAFWNRPLTGDEVTNQFNQLVLLLQPTLGITTSGTNAIIFWLSRTDPDFALESTTNLASPTWVSAGTPAVIGSQYVVTNGIPPNAQFYRLKK